MDSPTDPIYDRVIGTLYGVAIGDAMGMPTTFLSREDIKERYGHVDGFLEAPSESSVHSRMGMAEYTDDTELTFALAKTIIRRRRVDPAEVASELVRWADRHDILNTTLIGPSTRAAIEGLKRGLPYTVTGKNGTTDGCAMKISPVAIFDVFAPDEKAVNDVIRACLPSHNTAIAVSGASALCFGVRKCLSGDRDTGSIVRAALAGARAGAEAMGDPASSIGPRIQAAISLAQDQTGWEKFLDALYDFLIEPRGALTQDAVPAAVALFARSGGDFRDCVLMACNLGGDADTIGAMAGAMAGAYAGYKLIPYDWIEAVDMASKDDIVGIGAGLLDALRI
ncbi:MAG: ADP-ribosylglycohydrolase family protein [Nitrososphaerota archaeon]|nr:ADP-ribosylglycohydrolase family protein [Nitrososphaerota archaeon]MDG7048444.1 ADP-ribosylglycohydrolase family protein [Nitrososphaerota archaeon]